MTSAGADARSAGGRRPLFRRTPSVPSQRRPAPRARPDEPDRRGRRTAVTVGYEPRVHLLPAEVLIERRQRAGVRRAWLVVALVAAVVLLGTGGAYATAANAESDLTIAQDHTVSLLKQEQGFAEVKTVQAQSALITSAQQVGGSTEIDWGTTLEGIQASLPSGVAITGVQVDSATPLQAFSQSTAPLQGPRVATVTVTATTAVLPSVSDWITALEQIPGYVDANANSVTLGTDDSGGYTANLTIHLDTGAYDGKYAAEKGE